MISYGQIKARLMVLRKKHGLIDAEWNVVKELEETPENMQRKFAVMAALQVSHGRILECQVWQEWGERWPHIERPEQLPTERNTLRHDAISDAQTEEQAHHDREGLHRGNADQLSAGLPDLA